MLKEGYAMFYQSVITACSTDLSALVDGRSMFHSADLPMWQPTAPELEHAVSELFN